MIPEGYRERGDGFAVWLDNRVTANNADGVLSTPMLPSPFLVVSLFVFRATNLLGSCQVTVVDAPITQAAVADRLVPIVGVQLFPAGPDLPLLAGPGEETGIGEELGSSDALAYWPWYLHDRPGALALWVRKHVVLAGATGYQVGASIWPLERTGDPAVTGTGGILPLAFGLGRQLVPYAGPHAAAWSGRR